MRKIKRRAANMSSRRFDPLREACTEFSRSPRGGPKTALIIAMPPVSHAKYTRPCTGNTHGAVPCLRAMRIKILCAAVRPSLSYDRSVVSENNASRATNAFAEREETDEKTIDGIYSGKKSMAI